MTSSIEARAAIGEACDQAEATARRAVPPLGASLPHGARACVETRGCSFNRADGEALAGVLEAEGFVLVEAPQASDVVILNTCTVKGRSRLEFEKRLKELRRATDAGQGPRVMVAGCIPAATPGDPILAGLPTLGPDAIDAAGRVARAALAGRVLNVGVGPDARAASPQSRALRPMLPTRRLCPTVEILPIAAGCLGHCAFCQTRLARGRLASFHPDAIVDRARRALAEGARELWVTAQDVGAYGRDAGFSLTELLARLCDLPGEDYRVRLGMSSPHWVHRDLEATLAALAHPRMFRFLHVPIQSGSDAVLAAMRREGTAEQFGEICRAFMGRFPDGVLMTDAIVGYPTESEEDFEQTLDLLERARPALVNRSKFSPRPGTPAARLRPLPSAVVSRRSLRLAEAARALARASNERMIGRQARVLTRQCLPGPSTLAHDEAYRTVIVAGRHEPGRWLKARVIAATDYHLEADLLA
jgi:threonylcarbamoyladenosine tRNA methylthiotransferase CDKAL1